MDYELLILNSNDALLIFSNVFTAPARNNRRKWEMACRVPSVVISCSFAPITDAHNIYDNYGSVDKHMIAVQGCRRTNFLRWREVFPPGDRAESLELR